MLPTEENPDYDSPLEIRILAGDVGGVMDLIDTMSPAERLGNLPVAERVSRNRWNFLVRNQPTSANVPSRFDYQKANLLFRAIEMARFMCDPDMPLADYWMHIGLEDISAFKVRYQPAPSSQSLEKQLHGEHRWHYARHVHRAVIAGLIERPQTEEYLQSLFFGDLRRDSNIVLRHVNADPGLAPYLLELFDREGPSDASFAAVEKYCHDPELHWSYAFLKLCERGVYSRTQLLDKTLGTLGNDWPQFKSSWFSRFHDSLAPTVDEMAAFTPRYLALCHSRIAPTVGLAVDAVAFLYKAGHVDDTQLCEAMQPVITSTVKGRVLSALELLGQVVKNAPSRAAHVCIIAAHALAHTGSDVQKKAIAYLQNWGPDAEGQDVVRGYLPFVSAVNRAALEKLLGEANTVAATRSANNASQVLAAPALVERAIVTPLNPSRALQPVTQVSDLVERMAYVLENPGDVDEWERVAEALVHMAPIPASDQFAFLALKKRIKQLDWGTKPLGFALGRLMACALDGESSAIGAMPARPNQAIGTMTFIALRAHSLIAQAATGLGLPLLSAPTHRGGFIDPRMLVERIAAYQYRNANMSMTEQVFALMRLVPSGVDEDAARAALADAEKLKDQPIVQALRYALGGAVNVPSGTNVRPLFVAAARIRTPSADDEATLAAYGCLGPNGPAVAHFDWKITTRGPNSYGYVYQYADISCAPKILTAEEHLYSVALCAKHLSGERWHPEGADGEASQIRFAATLLPSNLDPFFAEAARFIGSNLDWDQAQWQNRAYLDVLLEPTTPMTPMGCLVLALALAGKEPGQTALAIDALVRSVQEGRLNVLMLGETLAQLWATPLVKGARYGKSLAAAAQATSHMPVTVFSLLCAMVAVCPDSPRKDLAPLLELLLELKLRHQLALPASTAAALGAMRLSGRNKLAARNILV